MKELTLDATFDNIEPVIAFVREQLEAGACDERQRTQILISVEEIFVNIVHYAYRPDVGGASIRIWVGDEVVVEFEDKGKPYNPLLHQDPDVTKPLEEREVGGLGIFMVRNMMDSVQYRNHDNKNILSIKKQLV